MSGDIVIKEYTTSYVQTGRYPLIIVSVIAKNEIIVHDIRRNVTRCDIEFWILDKQETFCHLKMCECDSV